MKARIALILGATALTLCSCNKENSLSEEVDDVNNYCNFRLGSKLEDFPFDWKDTPYIGNGEYDQAFHLKETREDGVDVYSLGTFNTFETLFYYKDGIEVGVTTADSEFGFSIFGKTIGYPAYGAHGEWEDSLAYLLNHRGYEEDLRDSNEKKEVVAGSDSLIRYAWRHYTYKEKLHIGYAYDPIYSFDGNIGIISVFLDD